MGFASSLEEILGNTERLSYGIAAYADPEVDGTLCIVAHISDITTDKKKLTTTVVSRAVLSNTFLSLFKGQKLSIKGQHNFTCSFNDIIDIG
jgi:hypothetical protein